MQKRIAALFITMLLVLAGNMMIDKTILTIVSIFFGKPGQTR
ncbi:MAG TPA: hypothetical protein VMM58_06245 [Bacteroidota bacterium]|nr:hypothetical protein [Bacteroidota bacterium]